MIFTSVGSGAQPEVVIATRREPFHGGSTTAVPADDGRNIYLRILFKGASIKFRDALIKFRFKYFRPAIHGLKALEIFKPELNQSFIKYPVAFFSHLLKTLKLFSLILVIFSLVSCGGSPTKPPKKGEQKVDESAAASQADEDLTPLELIPNPYLQNKVSVPAQAKQEFARAQAAMQAKKYKQAVGLWTLMTETYPKLSGPYVNLGIANWKLGELEEAENAFKFAIQTNKYNMDAYAQLGILYREQGKFIDAEQTYLSALEAWPHHRESVLNLGVLYDLYMGRFGDALKYYRLSQRLLPEPDKKVKGWIIDLERRVESASQQ